MGHDTTTEQKEKSQSARLHRHGRATLRVVYSRGPRSDPPRELGWEPLLVGRAVGEGHVELDDPHLSRRHAELTLSADGRTLRVVDTSSTGTEIDGRAAREGEVGDGGVLRMGDSFFVFRCDDDPHEDAAVEGMVGVAPPTRRVRSVLALVGPTPSTALLLGETGTGKELAARAIHAASGREGPLVAINCGAIPETLAEAQLFGHVSGAFTGARSAAEGLLRAANGGTVLLDEIGELPLALQPKLLRALEERTVLPVGATKFVPIDVRIVAATNKNLLDSVKAGTFRGDLYARLSDFVIELPPLRARREDILALAQHVLGPEVELTARLVATLLTYPWPFNVRELLKVLASMRIRARGRERMDVDLLDDRFFAAPGQPSAATAAPRARSPRARPSRQRLEHLLREHRGQIADVAHATGHSRRQVYRWLEKYGLDLATYRDPEEVD